MSYCSCRTNSPAKSYVQDVHHFALNLVIFPLINLVQVIELLPLKIQSLRGPEASSIVYFAHPSDLEMNREMTSITY